MSFEFDNDMQKTIDLYLNDMMSKKERITFENTLDADASLKEEVQLYKTMQTTLNENDWNNLDRDINSQTFKDIKQQVLSNDYEALSGKIKKVENTYFNKKKKRYYIFAAAASVLVFIALSIPSLLNSNTFEKTYTNYSDWDNLPSLTEKGNANNAFDIEGSYQSNEFETIIKYYENRMNNNDSLAPYDYIYLGASYFKTKNELKAISSFDNLINSNSLDSSKGHWYKLLIYLKQEDKVKVKETLSIILESKTNHNYKKALELSKKIDLD